MKGKLEALEVGDGLRILQPKELLSGGTEKPLDLLCEVTVPLLLG